MSAGLPFPGREWLYRLGDQVFVVPHQIHSRIFDTNGRAGIIPNGLLPFYEFDCENRSFLSRKTPHPRSSHAPSIKLPYEGNRDSLSQSTFAIEDIVRIRG